MLSIFIILAFGGAAGQLQTSSKASDIAVGLVEGFLFGPSIKQCIQDSKLEIKDVDEAINDFEKKDALDVLKGLREVADAVKEFPDALRACKASEQSVQQVIQALEHFRSPAEFAYHVGKNLWVNRHDIYTEIDTAVADYKSGQFTSFGFQVGEALHKLVVGVEERFNEFVVRHNKTYSSDEERRARLAAFADNYEYLYHVQRNEEGTAKYSYLSPFSDLSPEEFAMRNGYKHSGSRIADSQIEMLNVKDLPDSVDWRSKGAVNPVKNQAQCGSCWAFATVANIEGAGFVQTGKLVSLSEQELVDCDKDTGDEGCGGGLPSNAYKDMIKNDLGLELESVYPYKARDGTCQKESSKEVAFISGWQQISTDETQIAAALVKYGPLAIGINANAMQWYMGGVASPFKFLCNPKSLDHGVAIVGYGVEGSKKYWIIRNSWGASWGEKGYYRIIRGTGACGLNTDVSTATGIKITAGETRGVVV